MGPCLRMDILEEIPQTPEEQHDILRRRTIWQMRELARRRTDDDGKVDGEISACFIVIGDDTGLGLTDGKRTSRGAEVITENQRQVRSGMTR